MKNILKSAVPYITAIVVFIVISVGYFSPTIFEKKSLHQTDIRKGAGMGQDLVEYSKETGEKSLWSSRMFSGMPAYQISPNYETSPVLRQMRNAFEGWLPKPANYLFAYMLGFFLLLIALRINPWLAIIGAIAYAFSSYFLIIIEAGHIWKVCALELIPPTIAGIIWTYRGKYIAGGIVTALFFALQLFSNHIQMTYYSFLFVGILVACRFIYDLREKQIMQFVKASAILLLAGAIGFGANATSLILSQKYSEQTIRGKSELTNNAENKTTGLDKDYATQWSYGIGETFSLLIPNVKGGASGYMQMEHPNAVKKASRDANTQQFVGQQSSYWGDQPFTSGPVYVGAFIIFLFVFGLFVVKGYLKWALLIGTVFSILLAWGHNFMGMTNLFLDYFPFYNKFRAVSSILIVAELAIPILALFALMKIFENPKIIAEKKKEFYISLGATAGLALIFIILPRLFFNFMSNAEVESYAEYMKNPAYANLFDSLESARVAAFRADAWRSIVIILIGAGLLWLYGAKKINKVLLVAGAAILVLFDLASVGKRYLNEKDFVPNSVAKVAWEETSADKQIAQDTDSNYRVFNLTVSPFNDASTSYYHKSIGGYHAAKLRRYQELIDHYLNKMNIDVLNMLNTRYFIVDPAQSGSLQVQRNPDAFGNAWFVDSLQIVENADAEIAALENVNLKTTAVVDKRFANQVVDFISQQDEEARIEQTDYKINHITYKTSSNAEQLAVFSEIYYNDGLTRWEAFIDGQPVSHFRANYVLRALRIPAGEHVVEFKFKPQAYFTLERVSVICLWIILFGIVGAVAWTIFQNRKIFAK